MNTHYASSTLINQNDKNNKPIFNKIKNLLNEKGLSNFVILDDLKVNNSSDFGKGYGKDLFLKILEKHPKLAFTPSFSDCEEYKSFSGREEISMSNLKSAPKNLLNKFYLPLLRVNNIPFEVVKLGESDIVITNP